MPVLRSDLGSALRIVETGMSTVSKEMGVTSHNVSHMGDPDASRQFVKKQSIVLGGSGAGVKVTDVARVDNSLALRTIREQQSELGANEELAAAYQELMADLGGPGDGIHNALSQKIAEFENSIMGCATSPDKTPLRTIVVDKARELCRSINNISNKIQELRLTVDKKIATEIDVLNNALSVISDQNDAIREQTMLGNSSPTQEDIRDKALSEVAKRLNITTYDMGYNRTGVVAANNATVVDESGYNPMSHVIASAMNASAVLGGAITEIEVQGQGFTSGVTSGMLKSYIDMRDTILPNLQTNLDEITEKIRDQVNAVHNAGTAMPPVRTLTGTRIFTAGTDAFAGTGNIRVAVVDSSMNFVTAPVAIDLSTCLDVDAVITALNGVLGADGTASLNSNNQLQIQATNTAHGIAITALGGAATETGTGLGFSHYFGLNDLFVTGDVVYGGSKTGISNIVALRSDIDADPNYLATGLLDSSNPGGAPTIGNKAIASGDPTQAQNLAAVFHSKNISFSAAGSLGARITSFKDYTGTVLTQVSIATKNAISARDSKDTLVSELLREHREIIGINFETELTNLVVTQSQYALLGRVMSIVIEMMDVLANIKR